jgi:RNA polymerase sigma-70 factor (ECF subfamily)
MDAEDRALVEAFKGGEESAFTALVIKYREAVYRIARRMLRSHEDASDVTQEVFIRVHRSLARFEARSSLKTWLYRITVNLSLDRSARGSRFVLSGLRELEWEPSSEQDPAATAVDKELGRVIRSAVDELPPRQRAMMQLRLYQDLPYADIARIMGCAEGTVKATMFAGMAKLRKALAPYVRETTEGRTRGSAETRRAE